MDLSLRRLEEAVSVRRQIDALEQRLAALVGGGRSTSASGRRTTGRRTMSAATRAKIAAAARARWARARGGRLVVRAGQGPEGTQEAQRFDEGAVGSASEIRKKIVRPS